MLEMSNKVTHQFVWYQQLSYFFDTAHYMFCCSCINARPCHR